MTTWPFISCAMVTFARTSLVEEAVYSFLGQDYPGKKELVILNDYPRQTLIFDHPEVRIINQNPRLKSLGQSRNVCTSACDGEIVVYWDDDNIFLKDWLKFVAKSMVDVDYFQFRPYFYAEGWTIKKISNSAQACIASTKSAWCKIGGFKEMNSGEDKQWNRDLRSHGLHGRRVDEVPPEDMQFIYRWGHNAIHASGKGPDTEHMNGHARFGAWADEQDRRGLIPRGDVLLRPHYKTDWEAQAEAFRKTLKV